MSRVRVLSLCAAKVREDPAHPLPLR